MGLPMYPLDRGLWLVTVGTGALHLADVRALALEGVPCTSPR